MSHHENERVELWYVRQESVPRELLSAYERLMSEAERSRADRFQSGSSRRDYVISRALVRTALSHGSDVAPADWRFEERGRGRPEVAGPPGAPPLRFNLSHTHGLVACIVALHRDVGVDAEHTGRRGRLDQIAERWFAPEEAAELRALPALARRERFFEYWTLKESLAKALGAGLAVGFSRLHFQLGERPIRVWFDPGLEGQNPLDWQFLLVRPDHRHVLAASVRRTPGADDVRIEPRETIPLLAS